MKTTVNLFTDNIVSPKQGCLVLKKIYYNNNKKKTRQNNNLDNNFLQCSLYRGPNVA